MASAAPASLGIALANEAAVQRAFTQCSEEARSSLEKLQLPLGEHILREDVPEVLRRAAGGRQLTGPELAALLKCFLLDVSGTMSWPEFKRSWDALQALSNSTEAGTAANAHGGALATGGQRAQAAAAVAASRQQALGSTQPRTAQAEIGWQHAAAPVLPRERCEDPASRYVPLRGSDITAGGQGQSAAAYYGMYLSGGS